ncbi:MAG: methyltransferase, partial [Bacteroidota bacterium]
MPNDFFQFKQFRINQGNCGMKVTTESCVFGALIETEQKTDSLKILDVGSGTGLLSLMMAQRFNPRLILGVELDHDAYMESSDNVLASQWRDIIEFVNTSIQEFSRSNTEKYDLIISNPPFFKKHLRPSDLKKARAIHADTLPLEDLAQAIAGLLSERGEFHVLLPEYESAILQELLKKQNLYLNRSIKVYNTTRSKSVFRIINAYSFQKKSQPMINFFMRNDQNEYTDEFIKLLRPFYLH